MYSCRGPQQQRRRRIVERHTLPKPLSYPFLPPSILSVARSDKFTLPSGLDGRRELECVSIYESSRLL